MAQDVMIAGALFEDVPKISVPDGNNVFHPFLDVSDTTATASDVASGKYFFDALGVLTQGTASGGGGASNVVNGTFTAGTAGTAQTISINYSGNGQPIVIGIYPNDGFASQSALGLAKHQYAIIDAIIVKSQPSSNPAYAGAGTSDQGYGGIQYKSNANTGVGNSSTRFNGTAVYNNANATNSSATATIRVKSKNSLSVYVSDTSYGFHTGITYAYVIVYSS